MSKRVAKVGSNITRNLQLVRFDAATDRRVRTADSTEAAGEATGP